MLFLVDRHSSLLVGICMECIKERYMPVLLSSISLFGKALFYTQFGMASHLRGRRRSARIVYQLGLFTSWLSQLFVFKHSEGGGNGAADPERADQIDEYFLEDEIMYGKEEHGERTGQGKSPGSPGGDE